MKNIEGQFLKDKYWGNQEFRDVVKESVEKKKRLASKKEFEVPQKPGEKISHYLERLERITSRIDTKTGERGRLFLTTSIYPKFVIKPENISDEYIKGILLGNFAEQRGYERDALKNEEIKQHILSQFKQETGQDLGSYQIYEEERKRVQNIIVADQRACLKQWFDYLTSEEARHAPAVFRYWAFAEMTKLGSFDEERKVFNKRTESTAASFPELDQQALAMVFDEILRKRKGKPSSMMLDSEEKLAEFRKRLQNEDFGKLYAFVLEHVNSLRLPTEQLIVTRGQWRLFKKGSPAHELTQTISGFNTKWCIAGEGYAQDYLSSSDVLIYFSEDADGGNSIPRACIVDSREHGITEVRGIMSDENAKQHLDSHITPVVVEKLQQMPGGKKWQSIMEDMKMLARIHFKHLRNESLRRDELIFLYEIKRSIQGSGYKRDPRIEEIRKRRNLREDAPIILECKHEQIAWSKDEISENTKAYIGPLFSGIFEMDIENIYTSFPDKNNVFRKEFVTGPSEQADEQKKAEFERKRTTYNQIVSDKSLKIEVSDYGLDILQQIGTREHPSLKNKEIFSLIRLTVEDLFQDEVMHTTGEIYQRAKEFGLELCPSEVGPDLRLRYTNQPLYESFYIAMKQISGRDGRPRIFCLIRVGDGLWLDDCCMSLGNWWSPNDEFVFRLRPVKNFAKQN